MMTNGREIRKRRVKMGMTLERIDEVLNFCPGEAAEYEKGSLITLSIAEEFSWLLHCKVSDITR